MCLVSFNEVCNYPFLVRKHLYINKQWVLYFYGVDNYGIPKFILPEGEKLYKFDNLVDLIKTVENVEQKQEEIKVYE